MTSGFVNKTLAKYEESSPQIHQRTIRKLGLFIFMHQIRRDVEAYDGKKMEKIPHS